jgi:hypothetical protein
MLSYYCSSQCWITLDSAAVSTKWTLKLKLSRAETRTDCTFRNQKADQPDSQVLHMTASPEYVSASYTLPHTCNQWSDQLTRSRYTQQTKLPRQETEKKRNNYSILETFSCVHVWHRRILLTNATIRGLFSNDAVGRNQCISMLQSYSSCIHACVYAA